MALPVFTQLNTTQIYNLHGGEGLYRLSYADWEGEGVGAQPLGERRCGKGINLDARRDGVRNRSAGILSYIYTII